MNKYTNDNRFFCLAALNKLFILIIAGLTSGCSPAPTSINVQLVWNEKALRCQQTLPNHPRWQLEQLQLHLSQFTVNRVPVNLKSEGIPNQLPQVALLGGDCGSQDNWQLVFDSALEDGELKFEIGVPFELNHQNPLVAEPPLNNGDMFWTWQSGHKFLRLDLMLATSVQQKSTIQHVQTGWQFHLGSTSCQSASVMRSPKQACGFPNKAQVILNYSGQQTLLLDLAPLLEGIIDDPTLSLNSCMSDPLSAVCQLLLSRVGVGAESKIWRWQ